MKQGTANLAEDYCFIHKALRPVSKARRQIAAVPPSNSRPVTVNDAVGPICLYNIYNSLLTLLEPVSFSLICYIYQVYFSRFVWTSYLSTELSEIDTLSVQKIFSYFNIVMEIIM